MKNIKNSTIQMSDVLIYILLTAVMVILNFTGDNAEPFSLPLLFAMLTNGLNIPLSCLGYIISGLVSLKVSPVCLIIYCAQALFFFLAFTVNKKINRKVKIEGLIYAVVALLPYIFFSKSEAYSFLPADDIGQRAIIALFLLLLSGIFSYGFQTILYKIFRCRLRSEETIFVCVMGIVFGLGLYRLGGSYIYTAVALFLILLCAVSLKEPECIVFAMIASAAQVITEWRISFLAAFTIYSAVSLFFSKEGKYVASVTCFLSYLAVAYFYGVYSFGATQMILYIISGFIPCLAVALTPKFVLKKAEEYMKSYRERQLSRVAINRNRSVIGEQLFEVSSLFRQIEGTFFAISENSSLKEAQDRLIAIVKREMCFTCPKKETCRSMGVDAAIEKLVTVGCAKGRVSLVDLPREIAMNCSNTNGLLFSINKQLKDYGKFIEDTQNAASGRALLAEQAHGISEVLKNIALEQSRPLNTYTEKEHDIAAELARNGIISSEILIYGEEDNLTVTLTVFGKYEAKDIIKVINGVLGFRFVLSEKIVISHDKFSYILRLRTKYDAMFGVAARTKSGESVSGDTNTVIKIDERRFLVALADGCGSGENARNISDSTISLLESFYRAKMPSDTILSTVNRLLTFTDDDSFACLDLACVSLDDGSTDIVKLGAPLGFIFSESEIRVIEGESLPMGAVESMHPTTMTTTLKENDVLVFLSDGITAAFPSSTDLFEFIKDFTPLNPQKLADDILNKALSLYGGEAKDDMTVVAVRLFKPTD